MGLFSKKNKQEASKAEAPVTETKQTIQDSNKVTFVIDGKECTAEKGMNLIEAAEANGVYIANLCHLKGYKAAGSCRICTVKVNGRNMAACSTPLEANMKIDNDTEEMNNLRKAIVEVLFVEGNHFCPSCEKSGNCDLQALGYKYQMMVPRYPYSFPVREVVADIPKIYLDRNRCIMCKKCIRTIKDEQGKNIFAFRGRGAHLEINIDKKLAANMTDKQAEEAMQICPVGAIIKKEKGYIDPIGQRKYDVNPIGSEITSVL